MTQLPNALAFKQGGTAESLSPLRWKGFLFDCRFRIADCGLKMTTGRLIWNATLQGGFWGLLFGLVLNAGYWIMLLTIVFITEQGSGSHVDCVSCTFVLPAVLAMVATTMLDAMMALMAGLFFGLISGIVLGRLVVCQT